MSPTRDHRSSSNQQAAFATHNSHDRVGIQIFALNARACKHAWSIALETQQIGNRHRAVMQTLDSIKMEFQRRHALWYKVFFLSQSCYKVSCTHFDSRNFSFKSSRVIKRDILLPSSYRRIGETCKVYTLQKWKKTSPPYRVFFLSSSYCMTIYWLFTVEYIFSITCIACNFICARFLVVTFLTSDFHLASAAYCGLFFAL